MSIKTTILDFLGRKLSPQECEVVGIPVSEQQQLLNLALQIAISYIANTISQCEIKTYEGGKEVHDELYYLLNVNPNPNQSSSQFMTDLMERYFYDGEALVVKYGKSLYVADGFSQEDNPTKPNWFTSISIEGQGIARRYAAGDAFYFRLSNSNITQLVQLMYGEYGKAMGAAVDKFISSNSEKYKLELGNMAAGDEGFQKQFDEYIAKQLKAFIESNKSVYPQFQGTNLEKFENGSAASSSDIISMRKEIFEVVGQAFKIPMSMMYGNITNMGEIVKVYLSMCIDPLAQMLGEELTRKTTDYEKWKRGDRVVVDTSKILHVDILDIADSIDKLIASGAFTINQVLDRCGYDSISAEFADAHYLTKNYAPVSDVADPLEGGENNANSNSNQGSSNEGSNEGGDAA